VRPVAFLVVASVASVVALLACSDDGPPPRNGVNDVFKACQIRAAWTKPTAENCLNCVAAAPSPKCNCESFKEFGGICLDQENGRRSEPSCNDANDTCSRTCPKTDCACIENCYAQAPACKQVIAARDGCIADVCTQYCQ
jgi:hypothetical protein